MGFFALLGFLGLALAFGDFGGGTDDHAPDKTPDEPDTTGLNAYLVADGEITSGTEDPDLFTLPPDAEPFLETTIEGGGGDDLIYLDTGSDLFAISDSEIDGGDGDDVIRAGGQLSTLSGGNGDDTIEGDLFGGVVLGEAGNDLLTISGGPSGTTLVDGGPGNDTIDGSGSFNVSLHGGEGDDVILSDGFILDGIGYSLVSDGGTGDDTLVHEVIAFPPSHLTPDDTSPAHLIGGEGADTFGIRLSGGDGSFTESLTDPALFHLEGVFIDDFEKGTDVITVELFDGFTSYNAAEASLQENTTAGTTELTLLLQGDGSLPDQELIIQIGATGLTWDDINFIGRDAPTILQATP